MSASSIPAKRLAIISQSLYLANLLLLPGICFLILLWFFIRQKNQNNWGRIHLYRALQISAIGGIALAVIPLAFIFLSHNASSSLMLMLLYFVTMHAAFVLIGMLNLSRAMANKMPVF